MCWGSIKLGQLLENCISMDIIKIKFSEYGDIEFEGYKWDVLDEMLEYKIKYFDLDDNTILLNEQ